MANSATSIAQLRPNPKNPRSITDKKRRMLEQALAKFGDLGGIIRNRRSDQLVGGHQRREAFEAAGSSAISIERTYDPPTKVGTVAEGYIALGGERFAYREVDWPPEVEAAANLAANKGAGTWDMPALADMFGELSLTDMDLDLTMFDANERDSLLAPAEPEKEEVKDDEGLEPPAEPQSRRGDTYRLGRHTLHCGDSVSHPASKRAYDIVFTDPPYGVSYVSRVDEVRRKDWGAIHNDSLGDEDLIALVRACVPEAKFKFICCDWNCYPAFALALGKPKSVCVWDKGHFGLGKGYRRQHEFVMFYGTLDRTDLSDMWPFKRATDYKHPTQKPVPLVAKALGDVAQAGATVFDPFAGSGSTLMAAEQIGMVATCIEYEPKYVDVIIGRWESLTGETAVLESREAGAEVRHAET